MLLLAITCGLLQGCGSSANTQNSEPTTQANQPVPDNHEILIGEFCNHVAKLHTLVASVDDEASAEKSIAQVVELQEQGISLTARLEALSDAPDDEAKRLEEQYGEELAEMTRQLKEIDNVGRKFPALREALRSAIPRF